MAGLSIFVLRFFWALVFRFGVISAFSVVEKCFEPCLLLSACRGRMLGSIVVEVAAVRGSRFSLRRCINVVRGVCCLLLCCDLRATPGFVRGFRQRGV